MLSQRDISIVGTPSVRRKLPQTPQTPQNSSQDKIFQSWSESRIQQQDKIFPSWSTSTKHDKSLLSRNESINTSSELVDDHVIQSVHPPDVECRVNSVQFQVSESVHAPGVSHKINENDREEARTRGNTGLRQQRPSLLTTGGKMDYKKTAYLDARSYCEGLTNETEIDKVVKEYLEGRVDWSKELALSRKNKIEDKDKRHEREKGHG